MLPYSFTPTPLAAASQQSLPFRLIISRSFSEIRHRVSLPSVILSVMPRISRKFFRRPFAEASVDSVSSPVDGVAVGEVNDELQKLLVLLPEGMRERLEAHPELYQMVEIVMDLGRKPLARFPSGDFLLSDNPITHKDINHATSQVGDFTSDNRAGISRTLHRISAIRNREGLIVGLTCRVGRAISGSANLLRDLIEAGASLLLIGPPGVGKTTVIRDAARILADDLKKRVLIVDTSNEIGGDGDVPHPGIGTARRMQVPNPDMQHKVLIEAVENHMPQVIVIDEIGTRLEAAAASTIAQRGIQLVATAHGVTIENLIMNPSLEMLVGGIQSVTLGDEEASRRGGQKTILERKGPAAFTSGVEIVSKTEMRIHHSLQATVDALLSGKPPAVETRSLNAASANVGTTLENQTCNDAYVEKNSENTIENFMEEKELDNYSLDMLDEDSNIRRVPICLFAYGILEITIVQAMKKLKLDRAFRLTDNISEAHAFLALYSKLKKNPRIQAVAKSQGKPIYSVKMSSVAEIARNLQVILAVNEDKSRDIHSRGKKSNSPEELDALEEARLAIEQEVIPKSRPVELLPRPAHIILAQMVFVQEYKLSYEKVGEEPNVHLRILPVHVEAVAPISTDGSKDEGDSQSGVLRLPFLPA